MACVWLALLLITATAAETNDELYYSMPPLFHLDDYEACLATKGTFCLGSFQLSPVIGNSTSDNGTNTNEIYELILAYTAPRYRFNHTQLHRGYCITTTCASTPLHLPPQNRFQQCVNDYTSSQYGLKANLIQLDYCKSAETLRAAPIDGVDITFLVVCLLLLLLNVTGTVYDVCRNRSNKANSILVSWSFVRNFKNFGRIYPNDDTPTSKLNAIHGVKSILLMCVMLVHSIFMSHISYMYNPQFLELGRKNPFAIILENGTIVVQAFIILSSFIFTYNFLTGMEKPKKIFDIKVFVLLFLKRITRILPVYLFIVSFTATWSRFLGDGTLWIPRMEKESRVCRMKWWSQAFFVHNLYKPEDQCLLQSWFVAAEMQLYVLAIVLAMVLSHFRKSAVKVLAGLVVVAVICNYITAYVLNLKAMMYLSDPKTVMKLFYGEASFNWLYMSPWGSLPSSLLGILLAFYYCNLQSEDINLRKQRWFRIAYQVSLPAFLLWILSGYLLPREPHRWLAALYAAIDRPVFSSIFCVTLLGFFYRIGQFWWRLMSWSGWQVIGRMSLCVLMTHWTFSLIQISLQTNLNKMSIYEIGGHWLATMFMTYLTSVPLHLLVEMPVQRFLRASFGM
ncbi:unnamed protein product [Leptosia nina]|uniref:Acyltransferase 3 domain-containing protein n=1 Tax=Leptosia nina TaxID=320188 RepID=A0AAV1JT15_9NEOP